MKKLFTSSFFCLLSVLGIAQTTSEEQEYPEKNYTKKYFIATNSGVQKTPIGFRIGFLDKRGGYIGARFGSGYNYETDKFTKAQKTKGTLYSMTAGLIFPVFYQESSFKAHAFIGIGYGHWFDRPSKNSTSTGAELESGIMLSYSKLMITCGGNFLVGDGGSPMTDLTVGIGYKF